MRQAASRNSKLTTRRLSAICVIASITVNWMGSPVVFFAAAASKCQCAPPFCRVIAFEAFELYRWWDAGRYASVHSIHPMHGCGGNAWLLRNYQCRERPSRMYSLWRFSRCSRTISHLECDDDSQSAAWPIAVDLFGLLIANDLPNCDEHDRFFILHTFSSSKCSFSDIPWNWKATPRAYSNRSWQQMNFEKINKNQMGI